jgi:hypothetical protein
MKSKGIALAGALVAASLASSAASAQQLVLDTGTPTTFTGPSLVDANDTYAAEFSSAAGQTVTSIQDFVLAGLDQVGDTFTISLYSDAAGFLGAHGSSALYTGQATYTGDGWNGLTNLNWNIATAGNYWVSIEVTGGADSALGLYLPQAPAASGSAPAAAFAFNAGSGWQTSGAPSFGVQVTEAPLPAAVWLLASGLLGLVGAGRRRQADA